MKKHNFIITLLILSALFLCGNHYLVKTTKLSVFSTQSLVIKKLDSGFDADYDSDWGDSDWGDSDWGSGSSDWGDSDWGSSDWGSSDSGSSGYSNGSGGNLSPIGAAIFVALYIFGIIIIFILISRNRKPKVIKRSSLDRGTEPYYKPHYTPLPEMVEKNKEIEDYAYNAYVKIQEAWMNRDLAPVRDILSDEMYNMYQKQIDTLKQNGQVNIMKDFAYQYSYITYRNIGKDCEVIKVLLAVNCRDYITNEKGFVVKGNKSLICEYVYELTFVKDLNIDTQHCPNCGAELTNQNSNNCEHCGANVYAKADKYTLTDKQMLRQHSRRE